MLRLQVEHTLPQYGITTTFVNAHDLNEVENAIVDNTRAIYLETLGNPNSDIPDIDAIAEIAHKHGLPHEFCIMWSGLCFFEDKSEN